MNQRLALHEFRLQFRDVHGSACFCRCDAAERYSLIGQEVNISSDTVKHPYDNSVFFVEDSVSEYACGGNDGLEYNRYLGYESNGLTEANTNEGKAVATCIFSRLTIYVRVQFM